MIISFGLKSKILVTLVVLLGIGMLLVYLVTVTFWQRDSIYRELRRTSDLLAVASTGGAPGDAVSRLGDAQCGLLFRPGRGIEGITGIPRCSADSVMEVARRAAMTGQQESRVIGVRPALFFFGQRSLVVAVPVKKQGHVVGGMAVMIPFSSILSSIRRYQRIILVSLLVNLIVLSVVGLFRFIRSTVRPVENLVGLAESYSEEDGIPFLMLGQGDEFGQLSGALNRMMERIEGDRERLRSTVHSLEMANRELRNTQQEMIRAEKLASIGRLAAGMAHEIGNPLGIVQGYLGLLKIRDLPPEEWLDYVDRAEQELQRVNTLIRQLLDYSRVPSLQQLEVSLHDILSSLVRMVEQQPFMDNVDVRISCSAASDRVVGNPDQLRQVFLNCLMNSADAIAAAGRERGRVTIRTRNEFLQESGAGAEHVVIAITDNGEGIREEDLANVLDPFFTTKDPGKGTGLGLSVSHSIIAAHGGSMVVRSTYGQETTVEIRLPLSPE